MRASHSAATLILGGSNPALVGTTGLPKSHLEGLKALARPRSAGQGPTPRKALSASLKSSSLAKFEFCFSNGGHGMRWDGLIVSEVTGQARALGVMAGWKIYMIDGILVKDAIEAWQRLQDAQWQWRTVTVTFVTDFRAIRAEQKLIAHQEAKAEVERLARLPFANTHDEKHLEQIKQEFTFQGYIPRVEDRGVTLPQLQRCVNFAKDRCHRWRDAAPPLVSRTSGRKLHIDWMNWCHWNDWLVGPACKAKDCSLVEMMASQEQPAAFYLIHWWGDLVLNVMSSIKTHISSRGLSEDTNYWLACCANRPHSTQDAIIPDLKATCFYKAMVGCKFNVVIAVDPKTEHTPMGTCFQRLWCAYELSMCLDHQTTQLDIVQMGSGAVKASMVTQHLTPDEKDAELRSSGTGYKAKADREKVFLLQIMELAMNVNLPMTKITDIQERRKILNAFAQRDMKEEVLERHDNYSKVSAQMRALAALAFWRRTMSGAVSDTDVQRVQGKLMDALRGDVWRTHLNLDMAFMQGIPEKLKMLHSGLPPKLQDLKLDLRDDQIGELMNENLIALGAAVPRDLEDFSLDLSGNENLSNPGIEGFIAKLPPKLRDLNLTLTKTAVSKELKDRQSSLDAMKKQIADEAAKADRCTIFNLNPSASGIMLMSISKTKLPPPASGG